MCPPPVSSKHLLVFFVRQRDRREDELATLGHSPTPSLRSPGAGGASFACRFRLLNSNNFLSVVVSLQRGRIGWILLVDLLG